MARQFRWALAALVIIGSAGAAASQAEYPPQQQSSPKSSQDGRRDGEHRTHWWKDQAVMAQLGLTAEQSARIDEIFQKTMEKARPLRAEVQQLETALEATIRAASVDVPTFAQQVDRIETKRAELNKSRTVMLYRMRRVLTPDQNAKFQAMWDRREAERRKQGGDRR